MIVDLCAPEYYSCFNCVADKCKHSCCIGWEIDIDDLAVKKYESLTSGYGARIKESISREGTPHFRLSENDRCPHLDEKGLCRIITELGEGYLCEICREHPRFYNDTVYGKEVGIGMACEEAARLILSSDRYTNLVKIGEVESEREYSEFDSIDHRTRIYSILSNRSVRYEERIRIIEEKYGASPASVSDERWRALLGEVEYLSPKHKALFLRYSSDARRPAELEIYLERALAYFLYRHCAQARSMEEFCSLLGFSLFCERLVLAVTTNGESIFEAARIVSEELEYSEDNTEMIKLEFLT